MVKKYSPTVDSKDTPIMKTDSDGHFVHVDDYNTVLEAAKAILETLDKTDPSVFTVKRVSIIETLRKTLGSL